MAGDRRGEHADTVAASTLDSRDNPAAEEAAPLARGATIGRYIVLDRVGEGGMGVVYSAYDPELDRKVAVKLLRTARARGDGGDRRARLLREAQALARLAHPNIVAVHDVGALGEQVFIAMELVGGQTLRAWQKAAPRDWRETLGVYRQAAQGLAAAHALGIVHRDFKPDNAIVDGDGRVRVVDFGLARSADEVEPVAALVSSSSAAAPDWEATPDGARAAMSATLTRTGTLLGTPGYMAPEQDGGRAQASADQFSFCVALYEALYGQLPYRGETIAELRASIEEGKPADPPRASQVPGWLHQALLRGLAPAPGERHASMEALLAALGRDPLPRRPWLVAGVLVVVVALAAGLAEWRTREDAKARLARETRLAQTAQRVSNRMTSAYLLPLHDTRAERDQVLAELAAVRDEQARSGKDPAGLDELALGMGAEAIGDHRSARPHLEAAWRAGQTHADVAFALANDLARQYRLALLDLGRVAPALRAARKQALFVELAEPAIAYLGARPTSPPEQGQALIAYLHGDLGEAGRMAGAAFDRAPARYDIGRLYAMILADRATSSQWVTKWDEASSREQAAEEAFHRLQAVTRSDPDAYLDEARFLADFSIGWEDRDLSAMHRHERQLCDEAERADSERARIYFMRAMLDVYQGIDDERSGADPRVAWRQAIVESDRTLALNPHDAGAFLQRGKAAVFIGVDEMERGNDPRPWFTRGTADLERVAVESPNDDESRIQLSDAAAYLAQYQARIGEDPTATYERAEAILRRELALDDNDARKHGELGQTLGEWGTWQLEHGRDPAAALARSEVELRRAAALAPEDGAAWGNVADTLSERAHWEILHGGNPRAPR